MAVSDRDVLLRELGAFAASAPTVPPSLDVTPGRLFNYCVTQLRWPVEVRPHARICNDIDEALGECTFEYPPDETHNTMLAYPRNTWKTSLSRAGALLVLERNPNARQLIACFRHDQATTRARALRKMVEQYRPTWVPDRNQKLPWSDTAFTIAARDDFDLQEPSIDTTGIDRDVTGYHYDVIWMDDIVNAKNWQTMLMRDKAYNFLIDSLAVLKPGGVIVMPCTFWHPDDAYARLIQIDTERARQHLRQFWVVRRRPAIDEAGELFYPSTLTREFLAEQRARMGSHKFSAQYMLQCVSSEDRTFGPDHLRIAEFSFYVTTPGAGVVRPTRQLLPDNQWRYVTHTQIPVSTTMAWDPAGVKGRKANDYHGFTIVGTSSEEIWWVLLAARHKGPPTEILEWIVGYLVQYQPHTISCEDVGQSGTWLELLALELDRRRLPRPQFNFYNPESVPKNIRIATTLQPRWERDGIVIRPDQSALRKQFENFSLGAELEHEDELDSLVQHEGIALPATDVVTLPPNPIDDEWLARRARQAREQAAAALQTDLERPASYGVRGRNVWG